MIPNLDSKWLKEVRRKWVPAKFSAKFSTLCDGFLYYVALRLEAQGQWFQTAGCGRRQKTAILYLSLRNEQTPHRSVFTPHLSRESFPLLTLGCGWKVPWRGRLSVWEKSISRSPRFSHHSLGDLEEGLEIQRNRNMLHRNHEHGRNLVSWSIKYSEIPCAPRSSQ